MDVPFRGAENPRSSDEFQQILVLLQMLEGRMAKLEQCVFAQSRGTTSSVDSQSSATVSVLFASQRSTFTVRHPHVGVDEIPNKSRKLKYKEEDA